MKKAPAGACVLDGDGRLDARMGIVSQDLEILELVVEDGARLAFDCQLRQGARFPGELQRRLLHVIGVEMYITASPDEVAYRKIALQIGRASCRERV